MRKIYEAQVLLAREDFNDENEARARVERHGSGCVVTYVRAFDGKDRCAAMNVFKDGAWVGVDISR